MQHEACGMSNATATSEEPDDKGSQPLPTELLDRIRSELGARPSRQALASYGVNHTTLTSALAGLPIGRGSRAAIREALRGRRGEA